MSLLKYFHPVKKNDECSIIHRSMQVLAMHVYQYIVTQFQCSLAQPDRVLVQGIIVISSRDVFLRSSLKQHQPLINVGVNIMGFVNIFFVKIFQMPIRQNFPPSKICAVRYITKLIKGKCSMCVYSDVIGIYFLGMQ